MTYMLAHTKMYFFNVIKCRYSTISVNIEQNRHTNDDMTALFMFTKKNYLKIKQHQL